ncbi:hypothetical protein K502DRAFT_326515 [Neoconidiobolus thromboides FSU 785]|nr:hypothetical protein K502DRAFT_326515 [Neoconidiobolus thromboides FSU 785]
MYLKTIKSSVYQNIRCYSIQKKNINKIWILSDGIQGNENRSMALANTFNASTEINYIKTKPILNSFPMFLKRYLVDWIKYNKNNQFIDKLPFYLENTNNIKLNISNQPDLVISSGIDTVLPSLFLRKVLGPATFFTHIGYPNLPFKNFDGVILMKHELLKLAHLGPALSQQKNRMTIPLALNNIRNELKLEYTQITKYLDQRFIDKKENSPIVAFLMGDIPANFSFLNQHAVELAESIELLVKKFNARILITHSKRSPDFVKLHLKTKLQKLITDGYPIYSWEDEKDGKNPYTSILSTATHFVVPAGSVNLISEAITTRKPVYLVGIDRCKNELATLSQRLIYERYARAYRVSKNYKSPGDPLSYIGEHPPFNCFDQDIPSLAKQQLMELINEKYT